MKNTPKYIFMVVVVVIIFMVDYISHSEKLNEHSDSAAVQNNIGKKYTKDSIALSNNVFIGKEDVERYLDAKYSISSYNWTSMLLGVATLVVTLLGWFLWINILETKGHIKEIDKMKDDLRSERDKITTLREKAEGDISNDRRKWEEKYEAMEKKHTEYFEKQSSLAEKNMIELQTKESEIINRIENEESEFQKLIKKQHGTLSNIIKRNELNDEMNRLFLEDLLLCVQNNDLSRLRKSLYLSQLYSTDSNIRTEAILQCKNHCQTNIQDDIAKLSDAKSYYESIVHNADMVENIKEVLEFLKTK